MVSYCISIILFDYIIFIVVLTDHSSSIFSHVYILIILGYFDIVLFNCYVIII